MIGRKIRLLLLAAGICVLPLTGLSADAVWFPSGDKVNNNGFAVGSDGAYNEGDRIVNTALLDEDGSGEELGFRSPSKKAHSKRFKTRALGEEESESETSEGSSVEADQENIQFAATSKLNTLDVYGKLNKTGAACSLKLDGDITVKAIESDATINFKTDVTFEPYRDPTSGDFTGKGYSQLYFEAAEGKTINVNVDGNITFEGYTAGSKTRSAKKSAKKVVKRSGENADDNMDMFVTFAGQGKTIFSMADGTKISFSGDIDGNSAVDVLDENFFDNVANDAAGTKVLITMDNTKEQVDNGHNKVVFQRKNYADESLRNMVVVGNNSVITYVSNDVTGQAHNDDSSIGGYAAVAFDPSNKGTGRTALFIQGAYTFGWEEGEFTADDDEFWQIRFKYPFNEGSVVVAGHKVAGYTPSEVRSTLNYSVPAGGQAFFRVTDDVAYANRDASAAYDPAATDRRGLLVINDCQSVTKRAADPYWDYFNTPEDSDLSEELGLRSPGKKAKKAKKSIKKGKKKGWRAWRGGEEEEGDSTTYGYDWSYSRHVADAVNSRNVRNGFVVGVNGVVDVYHNCFLDYVAGSVNQVDLLAKNDYKAAKEVKNVNTILKKKNPAALVLDGLDPALFANDISKFEAANPLTQANPVHAQVHLRGNGALIARASGSSKENVGYIYNFWKLQAPGSAGSDALRSIGRKGYWDALRAWRGGEESESEGEGEDGDSGSSSSTTNPLDIPTIDFDAALVVAETAYNGYQLKTDDHTVQSGEGEHVVEAEGAGAVWSFANTSIVDPATGAARDYASTVSNAGVVNAATIAVDHTGEELRSRPLTRDDSYLRYNSPAFFFNNHVSFFNTHWVHSDATKVIDGVPSSSEPNITGGERLVFTEKLFTFDGGDSDSQDRDRYRFPEIRLYNSSMDLHESVNAAGVRFVVRDIPAAVAGGAGQAANNTSVIRYFDQGDVADTNFRGFGRIFMLGSHNNFMADGKENNWITESGYFNVYKHNKPSTDANDASAGATLSLQSGNLFPTDVPATEYDSQRAIHYFLLSGMEKGTANMAIGWPTVNGDSAASFPYDNTLWDNELLAEKASSSADDLFDLDGLSVPQAAVSIDGHNVAFAGFNKDGKAVHGPITRSNNQGVIYVNFGGKMTVTRPEGDARTSIPYEAIVDTVVAQKIWNDYNNDGDQRVAFRSGNVDLPSDQVTFAPNAAVQLYGIDAAMFDARAEETGGYVRVPTGPEEVLVNWYNREADNDQNNVIASRRFKAFNKKLKTRATELSSGPMEKPGRLLYVGAGDDIAQFRVAGATHADPFMIDVSGDAVQASVGRIREFASANRSLDMNTDHAVGESANAIVFVEFGGRVGLGSRNWNSSSLNPWNVLGKDYVQVAPLGDGVVDLNSNLIVSDGQALLATNKFGEAAAHRLTFYSENPYEIRVPAGVELDLSSFGQAANMQQIAFDGNVQVVVEQGASIRFPEANDVNGGVILYFNGNSKLIFEGKVEPQVFTQPFNTSEAANAARTKILGKGQIWGNKNAEISINGSTLVGVQSDATTPHTDVVISMNRDSKFYIGTSTASGGAFEVGNPVAVEDASVNFNLTNFGGSPTVHIDREGFLGLGAGVIDKHGNVNGNAQAANNPVVGDDGKAQLGEDGLPVFTPDTDVKAGWTIQPLFNVGDVVISVRAGSFEHNNIYDGSSDNASLMAVGPAQSYKFSVNGAAAATVKGGGNVALVPAGDSFKANVWDFAGALSGGERYSILASTDNLIERGADVDGAEAFQAGGFEFSFEDAEDMFDLLAARSYTTLTNKIVPAGAGEAGSRAGFVELDAANSKYAADQQIISRVSGIALVNGRVSDVLAAGAVAGIESDELGPTTFGATSEAS